MAIVLWFSGGAWSAEHTGSVLHPLLQWLLPWATPAQIAALHWSARTLAHVTEYAILALLWFRALRREAHGVRTAAWTALAVAVAWAVLDELLQSRTPGRTGSAVDVAIDAAGAMTVLVIARRDWRRVADAATTALLWTTSVGGAIAIVVNALAGVFGVALWATTPVAVLLLIVRRRSAARRSDPRAGRARRAGPAP
jgi:VanZ family protein